MKKIIIISPHFPPSNLTAVHRARIFTNHLTGLGWEPIVITVHEKYYEEKLDFELANLINPNLRLEKVSAFPIQKLRIIGDIGLRAFFQLYKQALRISKSEKIDFIYILIPSFYVSLLGRLLYFRTKIPYGIDYIDPWVHEFPGSDKIFSRAWFSKRMSKILEPIAVKNASLITGVSEDYYLSIFERNKHLRNKQEIIAMPFGVEATDFIIAQNTIDSIVTKRLHFLLQHTSFYNQNSKIKLVYAGAILPKSQILLKKIFNVLANEKSDIGIELYFIGTLGVVEKLASGSRIWKKSIFEISDRISYLDVLRILNQTDGVFILGSTETHYTPSKIFQAILSKKPILAVLHQNSSAVQILKESNIATLITLHDNYDISHFETSFLETLKNFQQNIMSFDIKNMNTKVIQKYSGESVTKSLASALDNIILSI